MDVLDEIKKFQREVKRMFQQILDLLTRIATAVGNITSGVITQAQAQTIVTSLTALAVQIEALAPPNPNPPVGPVINSSGISPNPVSVGAQVTIAGSGFGDVQGTGTVTIGGTVAVVTLWHDAAIVVTVPSGIPVGSAVVLVTTNAGTTATASLTIQ